MKCYDAPCEGTNPYPDTRSGSIVVHLDADLVLYRPAERFLAADTNEPLDIAGDVYLTGAPYTVLWQDDLHAEPQVIRIPAGFVTDLTSVPRPLRGLVSRAGPWLEAAITHDYLYVAWQDLDDRGHREADRLFSDRLMLAAMEAANVSWLARYAIYAAVRLFGAPAFHRRVPYRFANCRDETLLKLSKAVASASSTA